MNLKSAVYTVNAIWFIEMTGMKEKRLYRFAIDGVGIYEAMKKLIFRRYSSDYARKWWKKILDASSWLPKPAVDSYGEGLISWFTEKGEAKFRKTVLPLMLVDVVYEDIEFSEKPMSKLGQIIYQDEFQVVENALTGMNGGRDAT